MNLLFKKDYIEKIQKGEKTSTRGAKRPMVKLGGIYRLRVDFFGYLPDRIRVIRLYEQPLGSMT